MIIDTHSHIYSEEYNGEIEEIINHSINSGISKIILPNVDSSTIKRMLDLTEKYPDLCFPLIGIHPTSVKDDYQEELAVFDFWVNKRKFYGIGEVGIDLYWDKSWLKEQEKVFIHQLRTARKMQLPVSIHVRNSFDETFNIVSREKGKDLRGVFHAFSGTFEQAKAVIGLGFKIGVGGTVTFKNSGVDNLISQLSPNDIVLETDAPWLAPVPFRGKRNESAYLVYILKKVAEIFSCSQEEIAQITSKNAKEVFNLQ